MAKKLILKTLVVIVVILIALIGFFGVKEYQKEKEAPNKLLVTRPEDKYDNLPAMTQTITDEKKVKQLFNEIDRLPNVQKNGLSRSCPARFFAEYHLSFYKDNELIRSALLKPTGCPTIQTSTVEVKDALNKDGKEFITDLQQTIGLSNGDFYGYQNGRPLR